MIEMIWVIGLLMIGLVIWGLIGHGIWLAIVGISRSIFGKTCKSCNKTHFGPHCPVCSTPVPSGPERESIAKDIEATRRLMAYARFRKWSDEAAFTDMAGWLNNLESRHQEESGSLVPSKLSNQSFASSTHVLDAKEPILAPLPIESLSTQHASETMVQAINPSSLQIPEETEVHALDAAYETPANQALGLNRKQRVTADLLRSFMEQSNIRWIELISAALIVVCSVGLVISLWSTLSKTSRFFPSLVFLLATVAVHGAGQYTLKQWKLRTTSRGILHIGLMLIPLAVLVGILLSHRSSAPTSIDLTTLVVAGIGTLVYGSLAITASRSLYGQRWIGTAAGTMISGLSLLPIDVLGQQQKLTEGLSIWAIVPLMLFSLFVAIQHGRTSLTRLGVTVGGMRRIAGKVTQNIYALLVPMVFWYLQSRDHGGLSTWWWMVAGAMAASWTTWGWSTAWSSIHSKSTNDRHPATAASWLVISAWIIGFSSGLFLLIGLWQTGSERMPLFALLMSVAISNGIHGWNSGRRGNLVLGAAACWTAIAILVELLWVEHDSLLASEWIEFPRVTAISLTGILAAIASGIFVTRFSSRLGTHDSGARSSRANAWMISQSAMFGAGIVIALAAALTLFACCSPWGSVSYGGNWAPLYLIAYGVAAMIVGIVANEMSSHKLVRAILPLGQSMLLIGTVRFCNSSSFLSFWLEDLRPARAWSVGTAILAAIWAVLAATLPHIRVRSGRKLAFSTSESSSESGPSAMSLVAYSVLLSIASGIAFWSHADGLRLASQWGWLLPVVGLAVFYTTRRAIAREGSLLILCLWACSFAVSWGYSRGYWSNTGTLATVGSIVTVAMLTIGFFEYAIEYLTKRYSSRFQTDPIWLVASPHWAAKMMIILAGLVLLLVMWMPAAWNAMECLGMESARESFEPLALDSSNVSFFILVTSIVSVVVLAVPLGAKRMDESLWNIASVAPIYLGIAIAGWVAVPYSLAAMLWTITLFLVTSEWMSVVRPDGKERSMIAWGRVFGSNAALPKSTRWLAIGRCIASWLLITFSTVVVFSHLLSPGTASIRASGDSWINQLLVLFLSMGSVIIFALVRHGCSVVQDERGNMISWTAMLAASSIGLWVASSIRMNVNWVATATVGIQSAAFIATFLAGTGLVWVVLRNAIGIQRTSSSRLPSKQLLASSMRGARFQRTLGESRTLSLYSLTLIFVLSVAAFGVVILFPIQRYVGIERLGGWAVAVTTLLVFSFVGWIFARQGVSRFAISAIMLGLAGPLAAMSYANATFPLFPGLPTVDELYHPMRAMLFFWMMALAFGLVVRFIAVRQNKPLAWTSETAWIGLATMVGCLALVRSLHDPNAYWPFAELSLLALLAVWSSVLSGQLWRGHVAAVVAGAGMLTLANIHMRSDEFPKLWMILAGPIWVSLVAVSSSWSLRFFKIDPGNLSGPGSVQHVTSLLNPIATSILSFGWLVMHHAMGYGWNDHSWIAASVCLSSFALSGCRLWETEPAQRGLGVYLNMIAMSLVLSATWSVFAEIPPRESWLIWIASGLGAMAVVAGILRELTRESTALGSAFKLGWLADSDKLSQALKWMPNVHAVAALLALVPSVMLVLSFQERPFRLAATTLPFLGALTILPIASQRVTHGLRHLGLFMISVSIVLLGWADLPNAWSVVNPTGAWIFSQRVFVMLVAMGIGYSYLANSRYRKTVWCSALATWGWIAITLGSISGAAVLFGQFEGVWRDVAANATIGTKMGTLVGWTLVIGRLLQYAVKPLASDAGQDIALRKVAVYLAEIGLVLLGVSFYYHFPFLFKGIFVRWWPLVIFAIAMLSAGLGQWLHRIKQPIVADPIHQSSLLLPMIPLIGVWLIHPPGLEVQWSDWGRFAWLLLSASLLYALQGWIRNSIPLRALAAFLGLLSFWSLLHSQPNLRFLQHPQFWLLPPALASIVFAEMNRVRLAGSVVVATRYIGILVAYLSCASEVFLKAFEGQMWQPLLLLTLALAGVSAGMVLRVKAFLYCGVAFTFVALLGMVWHAQQAIGQIWPWWAFGIATGVSLIAALGYFEKNKPKVIAYLERLKQWES